MQPVGTDIVEDGPGRPDIVDQVGKLITLVSDGRITNHNIRPDSNTYVPLGLYLTWDENGELVVD